MPVTTAVTCLSGQPWHVCQDSRDIAVTCLSEQPWHACQDSSDMPARTAATCLLGQPWHACQDSRDIPARTAVSRLSRIVGTGQRWQQNIQRTVQPRTVRIWQPGQDQGKVHKDFKNWKYYNPTLFDYMYYKKEYCICVLVCVIS
jgi:hypothetical protein